MTKAFIVIFVIHGILSFLLGFSRYNNGSFFKLRVKKEIYFIAIFFGLGCILSSIIHHFWWGILITIAISLALCAAGIKVYEYIIEHSSK